MLLLRTFPLSFSILWRFLLVLPMWCVFYIVITVVSVLGSLALLEGIPGLGILLLLIFPLLLIVVTSIISMHPYLIGIRIGLRVLGFKTETSSNQLIGASVGYGIVEGFVASFFISILVGIFILLAKLGVDITVVSNASKVSDPMAVMSRQLAFGALTVFSLLSNVILMAIRAALLPAMANFAVGRNPRGAIRGSFDGFGAKFMTMMLLMLMITAISALLIPLVGDAFRFIGLTSILTEQLSDIVLFAFGEKEMSFTLDHALLVIAAILLSAWLFCLQCAGAALSYESRANDIAREKQAKEDARQDSPEDMAALRRSRMPNRSRD